MINGTGTLPAVLVNQLSSCSKSRNFLQAAENLQIADAQTNRRTRAWASYPRAVAFREVAQSAFTGKGPGTEDTSAGLFHLGI